MADKTDIDASDSEKRIEKLEAEVQTLTKTLKFYEESAQSTKEKLASQAAEFEKQSRADISGVSDAMIQKLQTSIDEMKELIKDIKASEQPKRKGWL